ncbi:MAG: LptA/OstA family protein, partial [Rhodobacterales bacterium]
MFFNINKTLKVFSFLTWFFVLQIPQVSADTNVSLNSIEIGKSGTIEVNSDSLKIDSNAEIATFDGNVEIKLNKIILKAQKITVTYSIDKNSKREITEILAINDVFFISNKDI